VPSHELTPEQSAQRKARIIEMRAQRLTWREIGRREDITAPRAHRIYNDALADYPVTALAEARHEESELIDAAVRDLMSIAANDAEYEDAKGNMRPVVSARTRVEAWSAIRGWSEHRAKLYGLYAPSRSTVDVVTHDSLAEEMQRLAAELGENDPPVSATEGRALDVALTAAHAGGDRPAP
jgi:hypothetical protein